MLIGKKGLKLFNLAQDVINIHRNKSQSICYLAGPMDFAENAGLNWRLEYREAIEENFPISCILPSEIEKTITNNVDLVELKKNDQDEYLSLMREIRDFDLNIVIESDLLIVRWEGELMSGTVDEVSLAHDNNIPVYLVSSQPFEKIPGWFACCCTEIFDSFNCLMLYLGQKYYAN